MRFPLDALWASPAIDAVGIDYYAPLSDWRDGAGHLDRALASVDPRSRLSRRAICAAAKASTGTMPTTPRALRRPAAPITDGLGKPWVFRAKDLWSWWSNAHYERVGGVELATPTAWVPQGKPIWLTEVGCPAVDKGANQPSVFPDPKSSEGGVPYFSNGGRDDLIQRRYLEARARRVRSGVRRDDATNPASSVYGGRMIDPSGVHLWTWDARPYPVFPAATDVWSDGPNWETGHWLTGRLGSAPLEALVGAILTDAGVDGLRRAALGEGADGYVIDRPMSPRAAIEPLASAYAFDAAEVAGTLRVPAARRRAGRGAWRRRPGAAGKRAPFRLTRAQETELPREVSLGFTDGGADYRRSVATSRRLVGARRAPCTPSSRW